MSAALENGHHTHHNNVANGAGNGASNFILDKEAGRPINRGVTPGGHTEDNSQPAFPIYHRRFANPAPLGLMAFATTTFVLSMHNVNARGLNATPNIVVGLALAYGGLAQLLAGMWEFAAGNTFGATAFSSYGAFWLSFAPIYIPWFGILSAFETDGVLDATLLASAVGIYLFSWMIVTFIFFLATFKSSVALSAVFFFLTLTFLLLATGEITGKTAVHTAGGGFGIVTAFVAYYVALAGLLTPASSHFVIPVGNLSKND